MKYINDKDRIEDLSVMFLKESGIKISDKTFSDLIEEILNVYYPAQTSFKVKLLTTKSMIQSFMIGYNK